MLVTKQLSVAIGFHSLKKKTTMDWLPGLIYLCWTEKKKLIQFWNNMRVSKQWHNFHYCVNYPFKITSQHQKKTNLFNIEGKINT